MLACGTCGFFSQVVFAEGERSAFSFYAYHDKPPYFDVGNPEAPAIYSRFIRYLNQHQEKYHISLHFSPRKRLESQLETGHLNGAVIGVHPIWFRDKEKQKYLWSTPFMDDSDVIIVRSDQSFIYRKPEDLIGKRLALPRGLYFYGVSELIAMNKVAVFETGSDLQNLQMIKLQRADATITSLPTYRYFQKKLFNGDDFKVMDIPHDRFTRHILFPKSYRNVFDDLAPSIESSISDPLWREELSQLVGDGK